MYVCINVSSLNLYLSDHTYCVRYTHLRIYRRLCLVFNLLHICVFTLYIYVYIYIYIYTSFNIYIYVYVYIYIYIYIYTHILLYEFKSIYANLIISFIEETEPERTRVPESERYSLAGVCGVGE